MSSSILVRNVIIVDDTSRNFGGTAKVAYGTARVLRARGINVVYFAGYGPADDRLSNVEVVEVREEPFLECPSKVRGAIAGLWSRATYDKLRQLLSKFDSQDTVVHVHSWTHALSSSVFSACKRAGFKTVVTLHDYFLSCPNGGLYDYVRDDLCDKTPCSSSCVLCNCDKRNYVQKLYRCVRIAVQKMAMRNSKVIFCYLSEFTFRLSGRQEIDKRPCYLPNPIDCVRPQFDYCNNKVQHERFYLFVGRFDKEKNPELFCRALTMLGLPGVLCGDGPEFERLRSAYPNLSFKGWCDSDQIQDHYNRCRALIMTSSWYEAQPLSCLEAMLTAHVPCIIPETCGAVSYIEDGETGLFFKRNDVDSLCAAIRIMERSGVCERLRENIRRACPRLEAVHSMDAYGDKVIMVYEDALAK